MSIHPDKSGYKDMLEGRISTYKHIRACGKSTKKHDMSYQNTVQYCQLLRLQYCVNVRCRLSTTTLQFLFLQNLKHLASEVHSHRQRLRLERRAIFTRNGTDKIPSLLDCNSKTNLK